MFMSLSRKECSRSGIPARVFGNPSDEDPVSRQHRRASRGDLLAVRSVVPEIGEADDKVADADPLEHAVKAHCDEVEEREYWLTTTPRRNEMTAR